MTPRDISRLAKGYAASNLCPVSSLEAKLKQLDQLHEAICAMQSLDDLGSPEANHAAMAQADALILEYDKLKSEIKEIKNAKV